MNMFKHSMLFNLSDEEIETEHFFNNQESEHHQDN